MFTFLARWPTCSFIQTCHSRAHIHAYANMLVHNHAYTHFSLTSMHTYMHTHTHTHTQCTLYTNLSTDNTTALPQQQQQKDTKTIKKSNNQLLSLRTQYTYAKKPGFSTNHNSLSNMYHMPHTNVLKGRSVFLPFWLIPTSASVAQSPAATGESVTHLHPEKGSCITKLHTGSLVDTKKKNRFKMKCYISMQKHRTHI